jgi:signal transduction histidine kinase
VGETVVLRGIREHLHAPKDIPLWVFCGSGSFAIVVAIASLVIGGSTLPLGAQVVLVVLALIPWLPLHRTSWLTWDLAVLGVTPVLLFTWSGGTPLLLGLTALAGWRFALAGPFWRSLAFGVLAASVVIGRQFIAHYDFNWLMWKTYVELALALGWAMRSQHLLVLQSNAAREEHAQLAALEERRAIARDVHDVLSHTLTILMVHVNSARLSVRDDPEGTAELLDEVAGYGREALVEIRKTVGLLSGPNQSERAIGGPIEAADAIEELIGTYRGAGADIDLRLEVDMASMGLLSQAPAELWKAGYRIVQESTANAVKHAPGSPIVVHIGVDDSGLSIEVSNDVRPGVVMLELPSGGNGVSGMRERALALGGTFAAGPESSRWVVRAKMPVWEGESEDRRNELAGTHLAPTKLGRAS